MKLQDEEYAIVSKKEFLTLKRELDRLKKNPLEGSDSGENLQSSIDNLSKSLNIMLEVFKSASDDLKLEEHESSIVGKQIGPMAEKIDTLIDQNQKIAKGIVAIADMVKEKLDEIEKRTVDKPKLPPLPKPMGAPSGAPPQDFSSSNDMPPGMGAPPGMPPPGSPPGMPPMGADMNPPGMPPQMSSDLPSPGMPPLNAPGSQPKKDMMDGLMR